MKNLNSRKKIAGFICGKLRARLTDYFLISQNNDVQEVLENIREGLNFLEIYASMTEKEFDDYQLNDISMGIWLAIKNQREVNKSEINSLQKEIESLKVELSKERSVVDFYADGDSWSDTESSGRCPSMIMGEDIDHDGIFFKGGKLARQRQRERSE